MPNTDRDNPRSDGFLARWSERKRAVSESQSLPEPDDAATTDAGTTDGSVADGAVASLGSDAEPGSTPAPETRLTDADMPPLESLDGRADYSGFLSPGVSPGLRRQALAQLFRSAHLNVTDGLDDFDEDFTGFKPMGGLVTADMRYHAERAARELAALAEGSAEADATPERAVTTAEAGIAPVASAEEIPAVQPTEALAATGSSAEADRLAPRDRAEPRPAADHCRAHQQPESDGDIA